MSIEPINNHVLELLNSALETSSSSMTFLKKAMPLGEEKWAKNMREKAARDKGKANAVTPSTTTGASTSTTGTVDTEMSM